MTENNKQFKSFFSKKKTCSGKFEEVKKAALDDIIKELSYRKKVSKRIDEYIE